MARRSPSGPAPGSPWSGRRLTAAALSILLLALVGAAVWRHARLAPHVLLITIDTLRADHLGCYGDKGAETPVLDGLAGRGTRFAVAVAHVPLTTPSHASILTGLTPLRHGIRDNGGFMLPEGIPTLASLLHQAGYRTAAFVSGFPLEHRFGLGRGFDTYDDRLPYGDDPRRAAYVERRADATTEAALRWLAGAAADKAPPWLLWVHYFDPHAPYEPPGELAARFAQRPYDGEIAFVDRQLGRLFRGLEDKGLAASTLVLVTSDHGESLGEHGEETHGVFIYESTVRVPWIMAGPGVPRGGVATTVARGIDVTPTLLDLAGQPVPASMEGRSLKNAMAVPLPDAPAYLESEFARLQLGWAPLRAWRTATWKLIDAPRPELYALEADGNETHNRFAEEPTASSLQASLRAALAVTPPVAAAPADPGTAERLRALGYLGGGGSAPTRASGRDPKEGILLLRRIERGIAEARSDPDLAIRELTAALREDPQMTLARRYRAIANAQAKHFPAAVADLQALDREDRATGEDLVLLGECLGRLDRAPEGLQALDRAARLLPSSPEPLLGRARTLRSQGREEEAVRSYEQILARAPDQPEALRGLADIALSRGELDKAAALYDRIQQQDPADLGALIKRGVVAVRAGRFPEAIGLFQKAVEIDPGQAEALLDLGGALAKSGRAPEAVPFLERALTAGPRTPVALNSLGFARLESGDTRGGLEALRASLALDPRQPQVADVVAQLSSGRARRGARP
jgi:arylsulfatase A-like enzyme/Flp pilus assembly protein TadD